MPRTWSCPFWQWEEGIKVFCDGCRLNFRTREARNDYVSRFCANVPGWEDCTVAQQLLRQEIQHEHNDSGTEARK